jgi:hypothetical protein
MLRSPLHYSPTTVQAASEKHQIGSGIDQLFASLAIAYYPLQQAGWQIQLLEKVHYQLADRQA